MNKISKRLLIRYAKEKSAVVANHTNKNAKAESSRFITVRRFIIGGLLLFLSFSCISPADAYQLYGQKWSTPTTSFFVNIGGGDGLWNTAFEKALYYWGVETAFKYTFQEVYEDPCDATEGKNGVGWGSTNCGEAWGETELAYCTFWYNVSSNIMTQADIVFNNTKSWNVYSTPWEVSPWTDIGDFRRVAVHELGHALGLDHENSGVATIMTSTVSDITVPQQDDINGVAAIYGEPAYGSDGISDILWKNSSTGQITLWFMNDDGTYFYPKTLLTNTAFTVVGTGDVNADGVSDILLRNASTGQLTLWFMNAKGTHSSKVLLTNTSWTIEGTGDVNGDGRSDILLNNTSTGQHTLWFMNTDGTHTSKTLLTNTAWAIVGTGDINADGRSDILLRNASTGQHTLWLMNADGTHTSKTLLTNTAWTIVGTGDINADGRSDILWRKASTGSVLLWFMNADGNYSSAKTLLTNTAWTIVGTGDFNADGISDILWRKASTGDVLLWFMNTDGTRASYKTLLTDTDWTVVP